MLYTLSISDKAKLGKHIYLAEGVDVRANVEIGDHSYCNSNTILFPGTIIGKYCSIGYNVQIGCPEHPLNFFSTSPGIYRNPRISKWCNWPKDDFKDPVKIGNDVWIGSNVILLQGVHVGNGAVIAAGAVVTRSIPDYSVFGGVPAKLIKYRFDEEKRKMLQASLWWDHDIDWIEQYINNFYLDL